MQVLFHKQLYGTLSVFFFLVQHMENGKSFELDVYI